MRATFRILTAAIAAGTTLSLVAASPAFAAPSDAQVGAAYDAMLTKADAAALGVRGGAMRSFTVTTSDKGTPDAPWLCDLSGIAEVEGTGARTLFASQVLALGMGAVSEASQEIHSYSSAAVAKRAYDDIVAKITQCTGQQRPTKDDEGDGVDGMTIQLTNGVRSSNRGSFLWVRSQATMAGAQGFASHQYLTVRLIGPYLQLLEVESEGTNAPDLTPKTLKAADALTLTLGDRWRTS